MTNHFKELFIKVALREGLSLHQAVKLYEALSKELANHPQGKPYKS